MSPENQRIAGRMSPDAQRVAIAEACGWTHVYHESGEHVDYDSRSVCPWEGLRGTWDAERRFVPDYPNDLNAMHEAEKVLLCEYEAGQSSDWLEYDRQLKVITEAGRGQYRTSKLWHATAAQRAEALLRTLGKWEEGK